MLCFEYSVLSYKKLYIVPLFDACILGSSELTPPDNTTCYLEQKLPPIRIKEHHNEKAWSYKPNSLIILWSCATVPVCSGVHEDDT